MKLTERFFAEAEAYWDKAAVKPFIRKMAAGTLKPERWRFYMLQDYIYIKEYIKIIALTIVQADELEEIAYLEKLIGETLNETCRVHIPNMKEIGITREDIRKTEPAAVSLAYVRYMQSEASGGGVLSGLTALLNCSWSYMYIVQQAMKKYHDEVCASTYRSWFEAYACNEYMAANQELIDAVDRISAGIDPAEEDRLCGIFLECCKYEDAFWDMLDQEK